MLGRVQSRHYVTVTPSLPIWYSAFHSQNELFRSLRLFRMTCVFFSGDTVVLYHYAESLIIVEQRHHHGHGGSPSKQCSSYCQWTGIHNQYKHLSSLFIHKDYTRDCFITSCPAIPPLSEPHSPCAWFAFTREHKQFPSGSEGFFESIAYAIGSCLLAELMSPVCLCLVDSLCPNVCLASLFSLAIQCLTAEVFSQILGSCTLKFPSQDDQVRTFSCICRPNALCGEP